MFSCRILWCYIVCTIYTLGLKGLMFCTVCAVIGQLDLELWMQALLLAIIAVKIMRNHSTPKIWWSILLPNYYTFPCIFVTSIWCEIKRITSTVLCLISLSIFSTCLLDNVQYSLIPMSSCFFSEWTHALTKFLKDQLSKIADFYQSHFAGITSSQHQQRMTPEVEQALKQWNYTVRLSHWLYEVRNLTYNSLYFHVWVGVCTCFIGKQKQQARLVTSGSLTSETGWMI